MYLASQALPSMKYCYEILILVKQINDIIYYIFFLLEDEIICQIYFPDKELYVCQTAVNDFMAILETLGGENEKQRAKELLDRCTLVADQPSIRSQNLPQTGKIRERSKVTVIQHNNNLLHTILSLSSIHKR